LLRDQTGHSGRRGLRGRMAVGREPLEHEVAGVPPVHESQAEHSVPDVRLAADLAYDTDGDVIFPAAHEADVGELAVAVGGVDLLLKVAVGPGAVRAHNGIFVRV